MNGQLESVRDALALLGVDRLVLAIHDQSFPSLKGQETGRGSPYSDGARRFVSFLSELGFNAVQLGPQGKTSRTNPSPYDSSLFSKNELSINAFQLAHDARWGPLLDAEWLDAEVACCPALDRPRNLASYQFAFDLQQQALFKAQEKFFATIDERSLLNQSYKQWVTENSFWLDRDSMFDVLAYENGTDDWRRWLKPVPGKGGGASHLAEDPGDLVNAYCFQQFVAHSQHAEFRRFATESGIKLFADLQIGFSQRDVWAWHQLFLPGYLLGAPPSRTNPDGQPWGYPVLNPDLYFQSDGSYGQALLWFIGRIDNLLQDFDGIRIDHPHGIVCPWVYKDTDSDALLAVQQGARLFESPNCADHPSLKKFAIARAEQLSSADPLAAPIAAYADAWVQRLDEDQVSNYATIVGLIRQRMSEKGFDEGDIICEVLSSCPYPLARVLDRHKLGRFRVTQKAQPLERSDVYRSDNAQAADWIMVGTHDTKPLWLLVDLWTCKEKEDWSVYLATRLEPQADRRAEFAAGLRADQSRLLEALFADLFVGPARNVSIFFADLLGMQEIYNRPGVVDEGNWTLSVPSDYRRLYKERCRNGQALDLPRVLSLALRARFAHHDARANLLIERLAQHN